MYLCIIATITLIIYIRGYKQTVKCTEIIHKQVIS